MQHSEPWLFDLPDETPEPVEHQEPLITEQQVGILRHAFDNAGITSMDKRQELIQTCTVRPITNIRELYVRDVRQVLERIEGLKNRTGPSTGSAWDNREQDTWIDKL